MRNKRVENSFLMYIVLFLIIVLFFVFVYQFVGMYYGINDDTTMMKIASGKYDGVPNGHTVFLKYALGNVIAFCYKLAGNIDWYGLFEVFCMFISYIAISYAIFDSTKEKNNKVFSRIFGALFLVLVTLQYVIMFQFITVAGTTCAAAIFLIAINKEKEGPLYLILEVFLLLATYLIRRKVLYMALPFLAILMVANLVEPKEKDEKFF